MHASLSNIQILVSMVAFSYWSRVDLQCCVHFRCTAK